MSKNILTKSNNISYRNLVHHLISAWKTGIIMPSVTTEGEKINIISSPNHNAPSIIMFGWTGSTDRYLSKYGKIHENQGYNVVRCIPSTSQTNTYFPYDELADEILRKLPEENWKNSIIVHLFSMNGCASFLAFWKKLSDDQKKFVKGIIFDSAPSYSFTTETTLAVSDAALSSSSGYNWLTRSTFRLLMASMFTIHSTSLSLKSLWDKDAMTKDHPYYILKTINFPKNLMFLYSIKDIVCGYKDIEKFHILMKEKGYTVRAKCWEDSPHVEHFRFHPEEYVNLVVDFVENSLNDGFDANVKAKI